MHTHCPLRFCSKPANAHEVVHHPCKSRTLFTRCQSPHAAAATFDEIADETTNRRSSGTASKPSASISEFTAINDSALPRALETEKQTARLEGAATTSGRSSVDENALLPYLQQPRQGLRPLPWYHYRRPEERKSNNMQPTDLFLSRLAMVGFSVSLAAELLTGRGPLEQLNVETGIPLAEIDGLVVFLIAFNVCTVLMPRRRDIFLPEEEELEPESKGILYESTKKARKFVRKIRRWQPQRVTQTDMAALARRPYDWLLQAAARSQQPFTQQAAEATIGRVAQLGLAVSLLGEAVSGKGPLAQLGYEGQFLVDEAEPAVLLVVAIVASSFISSRGKGGPIDPPDAM